MALQLLLARAGRRGGSISSMARDLMFLGIDSLKAEDDMPAVAGAGTSADNSVGMSPEQMEIMKEQLAMLRKQIDAQTYVMLYHLLPVHDESKEEASRSAWERFGKYKNLIRKIDDAPAVKRQGATEPA